MTNPLVSIIIPVFNSEKYIGATIASAVEQTWPNKEIIVVDDGSTDKSLEIAEKLKDSFIKVFSQENKGASVARNKGLKEAKGEYIQFLDADDLLSPDKIEGQLNALKGSITHLALCKTKYFYDGEEQNKFNPRETGITPIITIRLTF